jgi:hypothetical protein
MPYRKQLRVPKIFLKINMFKNNITNLNINFISFNSNFFLHTYPREPVAQSTKGITGVGCPSMSLVIYLRVINLSLSRYPACDQAESNY